ncbi:MFS transporter [Lysinibacillus macroides]|uniref:Membrane protein n=1 Tax=Lysinibacillus macroides TaxID=33935 RepID=A0A0M9DK36_9BACI|nr:MFS transporter [Lysinibacillus macroides]KOY83038.1 membrane protein [Lysinibacillus macroides]QPR70109.1 MFS transporter [Lysinibacillus macroides]
MAYIQKGTSAFYKANWALFLAGFITFANLYSTQPLLPTFAEEFQVSPAIASLSLSVTTFALAVSLIIVSSLSEAWGRKSLMTISIFAASLLTLALAFASNFEMVLLLRVVQGAVFAGLPAIAMAYLGEEIEPASLGIAMGLYISGNSVGGLSGRVIISTFTDFYNWHIGMLVLGGISVVISVLFVWMLPNSKHFSARPLQIKALTITLWQHLKDPSMLCLYGISFVLMGSFVTLYNYIGFKLMAPPYHLSATIVGWIFVIYLVGTFSSAWFGSLADRYGRQRMLLLAIAIMFIGAIITLNELLSLKIIGITVFTFGFFAAHSIASGWVSKRASHDKAQASSLYLFFYYVGSSVGGTVGGVFWMKYGWVGVIAMIALFLLIACVLSFLLKRIIARQRIATTR